MTTTKAKLEFIHAMAKHTSATVRQCEALMRYAATLDRLATLDCNVGLSDEQKIKERRLMARVYEVCSEIAGDCKNGNVEPLFSGDPRGAVLKIRTPDNYSNDFGSEGIVVPS